MRAVVTRVRNARVEIDGRINGRIEQGFLVLLGVGPEDTEATADKMADKVCGLRVFEDENGKMNRSLLDVGGGVLAVSQFTLCANMKHGRRPDFFGAARPELARPLFDEVVTQLHACGVQEVQTGVFGADMQVSLCNDGPVTLILDTDLWKKESNA